MERQKRRSVNWSILKDAPWRRRSETLPLINSKTGCRAVVDSSFASPVGWTRRFSFTNWLLINIQATFSFVPTEPWCRRDRRSGCGTPPVR